MGHCAVVLLGQSGARSRLILEPHYRLLRRQTLLDYLSKPGTASWPNHANCLVDSRNQSSRSRARREPPRKIPLQLPEHLRTPARTKPVGSV